MAGREYLYWPYPADKPQLTACVTSCPTEAGKTLVAHFTNGTTLTFTSYVTKADYHFCLPSDSVAQAATNVAESIASQTYGRLMADLGKAWPALVAASIIAVVLGFLYMTMLFYLGGCLVYSTIVIMLCLMALGGWLLFHRGSIMASGTSASLLKWGGIALWILDAVFLLVCLALRRSISIAVACLKEATVAIGHMKVADTPCFPLAPLTVYSSPTCTHLPSCCSTACLAPPCGQVLQPLPPHHLVRGGRSVPSVLGQGHLLPAGSQQRPQRPLHARRVQ